jgi:hypothetical protein
MVSTYNEMPENYKMLKCDIFTYVSAFYNKEKPNSSVQIREAKQALFSAGRAWYNGLRERRVSS